MKSSYPTVHGISIIYGGLTRGSIPIVFAAAAAAAACGISVVIAWRATVQSSYNYNSHYSRSMLLSRKTAYRRVKEWLTTPVPNKKSIRQAVRLRSSAPKTDDNNNNDNPTPIDDNLSDGLTATNASTSPLHHQQHQRNSRFTTIEDTMMANGGTLNVRPIGTIRSVYRLCVGTPRQGMLAPHARARIELHNLHDDRTGVAAAASVDGLQHFSHIWIVFIFHLNTVGKRKHSKIAPPALGGEKVGVLATRSPHRLNPIGMTLAKLDGIRTIPSYRTAQGRKQGAMTVLDISGSDLVDGTPILDIKPYVPTYDAVAADQCVVPNWVADGLSTARSVQFTPMAETELRDIVWNHLDSLEFYKNEPTSVPTPLANDSVYDSIKACIEEVLAVDVRSQHQTNKARLGLSRAEKADRIQQQQPNESMSPATSSDDNAEVCTQQLDNLLISFTVTEAKFTERAESIGSGAEDIVIVQTIRLFDIR